MDCHLYRLDSPVIKGTAVVKRIDATGTVVEEVREKNLILASFWNGLMFRGGNSLNYFPASVYHYAARTYISTEASVPHPYETTISGVFGVGTNHPSGWINRGIEDVTGWPYIEIHNIYSVTGQPRTFYSVGLVGGITIPTNDYATPATLDYPLTRLRLAAPVTQGATDQIDITYRLYFQEEAGSATNPYLWAYLTDWAFRQTSATTNYASYNSNRGVTLSTTGTEGSPLLNGYNLHCNLNRTSATSGLDHVNLHEGDFGVTRSSFYQRASDSFLYRWGWRFTTDRSYVHGIAFNEWWPCNAGYYRYPYREWAGKNNGWKKAPTATAPGYSGYGYVMPLAYSQESQSGGPFHNTFNHSASSMKLVYDINALPRTTWKATFSGTWPSDDKYPLFGRVWYSEGGPLDGTAKYKIAFCRTFSTRRGYARDMTNTGLGYGALEAAQSDNSTTYIARKAYNGARWQKNTDLALGHVEYADSRFGNLGWGTDHFYIGQTGTSYASSTSGYKSWFNVRKMPGLTMNTWWGYQTGKNGKTDYIGVEFRKLSPFLRQVWQKGDISPNLSQIDWLHPCNGMPGELDEEKAIVCDATSGIYLINATTDLVTTLTTETGFVQAWYTRDNATGVEEYHAVKNTGGTWTLHSNLVNNFQGTNADYWTAHGGSTGETWFNAYADVAVLLKSHWRLPHIYIGLRGSATYYGLYVIYYNARTGASGAYGSQPGYWTTQYVASNDGAEYFGDVGEQDVGITVTNTGSMRADTWRNTIDSDWLTFEPGGLLAWLKTTYSYLCAASGFAFLAKTSDTDFGTVSYSQYEGATPWAAPHGITPLPNYQSSSHPHSFIGSRKAWSSTTNGIMEMEQPLIVKGGADTGSTSYSGMYLPVTHFGARIYEQTTGQSDYGYQSPGDAIAGRYDIVSNGRVMEGGVDKYKGVVINGHMAQFIAPMFTERTTTATSKSLTHPSSWPLNPLTDATILHPMRWDVFGWDAANSTWVKEEWSWDYDTMTWHVDPATVFPGRPAPTGGGTHALTGITQYPYSGLQLTWEDMRPESSVDPELGEWHGQYMYNGLIMDGVTEYTFSAQLSNLPMIKGQISTTIPSSGFIRVPEANSSRFSRLDNADTSLHSVQIAGSPVGSLAYSGDTPAAGDVNYILEGFLFNPADTGKQFDATYTFLQYGESDDPLNWASVTIGKEDIVAASSNDLLGGQAYKDSATLVSEGWTVETTSNPSSSFAVSASSYAAQLPDGFPVLAQTTADEGQPVYAERLAFQRYTIGCLWTNATTTPSTSDYGNTANSSGAPTYGGIQFLYDTSHGIAGIHSRVYTDAATTTWLVFRVDHYYSNIANPIVWELWINTSDPWNQEFRFGVWSATNANYTGDRYHGIHYRSGGSFTKQPAATWPNGTPVGFGTYASDINRWSYWGRGPEQWSESRFMLNMDPFSTAQA